MITVEQLDEYIEDEDRRHYFQPKWHDEPLEAGAGWGGFYELLYEMNQHDFEGLGTVTLLDQFGGEGQGDDYWIVFSVESDGDTQIFRRNGYHASFDGSYLDGPTQEVVQKEKLITVWEKL